jgi:hypothetical protein
LRRSPTFVLYCALDEITKRYLQNRFFSGLLVFILDVNPDYQAWLVERSRLFAAVNTRDGDKKRGLLLIE